MSLAPDKLTLCAPNRIDEATLSGGSYTAARPLSNAQVRELQERARTADTDPSSTQLRADLPARRAIGALAIAAHNLSASAQIRYRVLGESDALLHDSGWVDAWPVILTLDDLEWEDDRFWTATLTDEERAEFTPLAWHVFAPVTGGLAFTVEINDAANSAGFVEFGRLFVANVWQPQTNMGFGAAWGWDDATEITEGDGALVEFFDVGPRRRTFVADLGVLTESEAFARLGRLKRNLGTSGEILLLHDLRTGPTQHQRVMLARLTQLDRLAHPFVGNWDTAINAREVL